MLSVWIPQPEAAILVFDNNTKALSELGMKHIVDLNRFSVMSIIWRFCRTGMFPI
jgi:hypothetical protein